MFALLVFVANIYWAEWWRLTMTTPEFIALWNEVEHLRFEEARRSAAHG